MLHTRTRPGAYRADRRVRALVRPCLNLVCTAAAAMTGRSNCCLEDKSVKREGAVVPVRPARIKKAPGNLELLSLKWLNLFFKEFEISSDETAGRSQFFFDT